MLSQKCRIGKVCPTTVVGVWGKKSGRVFVYYYHSTTTLLFSFFLPKKNIITRFVYLDPFLGFDGIFIFGFVQHLPLVLFAIQSLVNGLKRKEKTR